MDTYEEMDIMNLLVRKVQAWHAATEVDDCRKAGSGKMAVLQFDQFYSFLCEMTGNTNLSVQANSGEKFYGVSLTYIQTTV